MMKKILFTGGTGFLGRNLLPSLCEKYVVYAPSRSKLNLTDTDVLKQYVISHNFDVIIHAAIPNISFHKDKEENLLKDSLSTFMVLYQLQDYYDKLLYFGSGAEFNKDKPIISISENDFGKEIPQSDYGLAKYIMNSLCRSSRNIYNLRIFGCYGPTDAEFKLITSAIRSCLADEAIHLRQNCVFDFMWVMDLIPVLDYFINNSPKFHDYNVCTGRRTEIVSICQTIQTLMSVSLPINIDKSGFNNEYSGNNKRLCNEIPLLRFTSLSDGIRKQIEYERGIWK